MAIPTVDVAALFNNARQIKEPEARRQFLLAAAGADHYVLTRVEALLRVHEENLSFLEVPAVARPAAGAIREGPGTHIGPYELTEQIGEGGFGVVFKAEQREPLRRTVAVKILKAGVDTRHVVARFEAERQTLALMDHPHIARVIDGGETASGRPYFVMELVHGMPITRFCDENQLTPRERLGLFAMVCQAVQHAHQKGIIHRDLKPNNMLVGSQNGKPAPKLIDFGVAKALGQQLTERTLATVFGDIVGTLEYMSPEQAELNAMDIDTRADIYSLGVLLYELLTGTTPLTHDRVKQAAITEVLRLIRDEDPPKPSARLSESKDSLMSISAQRKLEPARLTKEIRGDLDWIVMKALEKDRDRRYATAGNFAEDVERYLNGDAILARPPSAAYRLRKFAHRNRGAVLAGAAVGLALVLGTLVSAWQAVVATQAQRDALAAAAAQVTAKNRADAKAAEARAVLDFMEKRIVASARPKGQDGGLGHDVTLRAALVAALPAVDTSFANQPLVEARLRMTLGDSFRFLGEMPIAADQFQRARAIYTKLLGPDHADTLTSTHNLAITYDDLGRYADAVELYEKLHTARKANLGAEHADTLRICHNLAIAYTYLGRHDDALKLCEETFAIQKIKLAPDDPDLLGSMNTLANCYLNVQRYEDGRKLHEETLTARQAKLGPDHPVTLRTMSNLASSYAFLGRHADALKLREETLALQLVKLGSKHPDTLTTMNNLANSYLAFRRYKEALKLHEEALAIREANGESDLPDTLTSMYNVARCHVLLGQFADALQLHETTLARRTAKLGANHPDTLLSLWRMADVLIKLDRGVEAVPILDDCFLRAAGKVVDPSLMSGLADSRIRHFKNAKDVEGCRQTNAMWEKLNRKDASFLYDAACMRAVTAAVIRDTDKSPDAVQQANAETDQAMVWLQKAAAAGYKNVAHMRKDNDLTILRDRPDFQLLLAGLEAPKQKEK